MEKQSIVGIAALLIPAAFMAGTYWGGRFDYRQETVKILSCSSFSENDLEHLGFTGNNKKDSCEELNLALMNEAMDRCADIVSPVKDLTKSQYDFFVDRCVYHDLSNAIALPTARALMDIR